MATNGNETASGPVKAVVIGGGSWGTALAAVLAQRGHDVVQWARESDQARSINETHQNTRYLPGIPLPPNLRATSDLGEAVSGRRLVVSVVPSHAVRDVMARAVPQLAPDAIVVSASKGIEWGTLAIMSDVLGEVLPPPLRGRVAVLSGPSFAKETVQGQPTAVVVASLDAAIAVEVQAAFQQETFRVYTSHDVVGVELAGALKNVIAVAAGMAEGMGLGHNTKAALMTRGLAELSRLAEKKGADPLTLAGLAGMGDLVLTCTGGLSRNRQVGEALGRGETLEQILARMNQVAEGVKTAKSSRELALREGVDMPIVEQVYKVIYEGQPAKQALYNLLRREAKAERELKRP
jgi:glycerol-3-phosphate dehydrogenase (NAD(P)+)